MMLEKLCRRICDLEKRIKSWIAIKHLGFREYRRAMAIESFTNIDELCSLHVFVALNRIKVAVEVGSHFGKSALFIASAMPKDGILYCIDTWANTAMPGGKADTMTIFERNTLSVRNRLKIIRKASSEITASDIECPVDLCFIDADHRYESVRGDIIAFSKLIRHGGWLAFHDFGSWGGVTKAVAEELTTLLWRPVLLEKSLFIIRKSQLEADESKWQRLQCQS